MASRLLLSLLLCASTMSAHAYTSCHGTTIDNPAERLMPCPDTPNCVSTDHAKSNRRLPAPNDVSLAQVRRAVEAEARSSIVAEGDNWLIAHFKSRLFGFVDEAHFIARPDGSLAMRSGACSGYWDMGVNGRRMERLLERAREDQSP